MTMTYDDQHPFPKLKKDHDSWKILWLAIKVLREKNDFQRHLLLNQMRVIKGWPEEEYEFISEHIENHDLP